MPSGLRAIRGVYGAALLIEPGVTVHDLGGGRADAASRVFARVLGARQLAQAALLGGGGRGPALTGASIDAVHACTALWLARVDPSHGRKLRLNAAVASILAADGLLRARRS